LEFLMVEMICVENLWCSVGTNPILKGLSLTLSSGEFLSVVGPNGAGKSSLLKCLLRIMPGARGSIRIAGKELSKYRQKELARLMSYVPQAEGRFFPYTVKEFVLMGRYSYLGPFKAASLEDERAVDRALLLIGMQAFASRNLGSLSGGERQKVFIAAALVQNAKVMLLDEPTSFLDYRHQLEVWNILRDVNAQGVSILCVTHDVSNAMAWSQRILALNEGSVVFHGEPTALTHNGALEEVFSIPFSFVRHPDGVRQIPVPRGRS
jgi:iron complex transport system ATP-binding protein